MEKNIKQKKGKRKWLFIFIPIVVLALAAGITYGIVDYKLGLKQNDPKKELVNAVIKDVIENPTEIKGILDSVTIKDQDSSGNNKGTTTSNADQNSSNKGTTTSTTKSNESASNGSTTSTIADLQKNYSDYSLLSSSAVNLGGSTYHLTATVKNKKTGEVKTVEVTTKLSESTKNMLKNYRNGN